MEIATQDEGSVPPFNRTGRKDNTAVLCHGHGVLRIPIIEVIMPPELAYALMGFVLGLIALGW